jgi:FAD/FMN-containing dehydrogenase/uncharacterized membrane protein YhaH (DUF805 family)/SAM-dependent methyltransferase
MIARFTRRDNLGTGGFGFDSVFAGTRGTRGMDLIDLLYSLRGRVSRGDFWYAALLVLSMFVVLSIGLSAAFGGALPGVLSVLLYMLLYWSLAALSIKRYHDLGRSGWWLLLLAIPLVGPAWVLWTLLFRKGKPSENRFGALPGREEHDYLTVGSRDHGSESSLTINDVTGLNAVRVRKVLRPESVADLQHAIAESSGPISIGGGRFSMGGQTASADSLHIDMRSLNRVLCFSPSERWIRVQPGIRWCDIQWFIDPHDLSVKIMQTYANFTVGGSLSVNSHGRYVGLGPLILSVRAITLVLADGSRVRATPTENSEVFYGAIGGYGGLGVIVDADLDLAENRRVQRVMRKLPTANYLKYFRDSIRNDRRAVFHNGDLYPPHYAQVLTQTWVETAKPVTQTNRLMALRSSFPLERYGLWAVTETPFGNWRREHVFDPLLFFREKVHWRNYEAGYDAAVLEPATRSRMTYVLQEYFVPVERFDLFVPRIAEILNRHRVNVVNISIRHAHADTGSMLAWAREEVFAFVLYYKQGVAPVDKDKVGVWTRELVDAALAVGGTYYLPYQVHPRPDQFHRAFPRAQELFALKRKLDPRFRFRNALWNTYYTPMIEESAMSSPAQRGSEFRAVFNDVTWSDKFYRFLQNIFHLYPEDRFHALIKNASARFSSDQDIYNDVQAGLPKIKPFLGALTHALPALKKQKREMARQTLELLGNRRAIDGYVEIGSTGRYVSELRKHVRFTGPIYITNDIAPGNGLSDIMERGQFARVGTFLPLDYKPLDGKGIVATSIDVVTSFIGLHHSPPDLLDAFVRSIHRILRPGGLFIVRDHDAGTPRMQTFVSLVHTVFNAGLDVPWQTNAQEEKQFRSADEWSQYLVERGFTAIGKRLLQANDPTDNTLMGFVKSSGSSQP